MISSLRNFPALRLVVCAFLIGIAKAEQPPAAAPTVVPQIAYKAGEKLDDYERERCKLDLYLPPGGKGFATLVWFHGGGLKGGNNAGKNTVEIARALAGDGLAVAAVNYRLSPKATYPAYIEDAAAAAAWVRAHIAEHGGDPAKVFIGGHSAGGYLTLMLALDAHYFGAHALTPESFAGYIPVSGQTMTHYTVREERGIDKFTIVADEAAPVHYCRKDTPPMLVFAADHDMAARAEENEYLVATLKGAGNTHVVFQKIADRNHGTVADFIAKPEDPVRKAILAFTASNTAAQQMPAQEKR